MKHAFALLLMAAALSPSAFADKGGHPKGEDRGPEPKKNDDRRPGEKPGHEGRPSHYEREEKRSPRQSHEWQQSRGWERHDGWRGHDDWHGGRSHHWDRDHRTWAQRGGYGGYYVPWLTFSMYFGSHNSFRIESRPEMDHGYPRFRHHGQNFLIVDPWPDSWDDDWYESDDVYIEYDNGYYLHNRRHSGIALSVVVVD